jgi:hypothetical protein
VEPEDKAALDEVVPRDLGELTSSELFTFDRPQHRKAMSNAFSEADANRRRSRVRRIT